jgi:hypothetical protein
MLLKPPTPERGVNWEHHILLENVKLGFSFSKTLNKLNFTPLSGVGGFKSKAQKIYFIDYQFITHYNETTLRICEASG